METPRSGDSSDQSKDTVSVEETVVFDGAPPTGLLEQPKKSFLGPGLLILIGCIVGLVIVFAFFR